MRSNVRHRPAPTKHLDLDLQFSVRHLADEQRVIDARNAFVMNSLLQEITRSGTAARAQATLKRTDLFGKTGTTNDAVDAWFVGYHSKIAAIAWIGYDQPKNMGNKETGGGLALPIWIGYMQQALKGEPVAERPVPAGLINVEGEWYYEENPPGAGVTSLDTGVAPAAPVAKPPEAVKNELF